MIARYFKRGSVKIAHPSRSEKHAGISRTDSLLLAPVEETQAEDFLVNDRTLLRKAQERGIPARVTADFVWALWEDRKITRSRRDAILAEFVARGRYSDDFLQVILLRE